MLDAYKKETTFSVFGWQGHICGSCQTEIRATAAEKGRHKILIRRSTVCPLQCTWPFIKHVAYV